MTQHLSPQEFIDAAETGLASPRASHLEACASCRDDLASLRQLMRDVDVAAEVPEPSPLFWDHFSQRVRAATARDQAAPWWPRWRVVSIAGLLSAAVMLIALQVRQPTPRVTTPDQPALALPRVDAAADAGSWDQMVTMASSLSTDDLHHLAAPMVEGADTASSDLTPAEQQELARLIRREMGGTE